MLKVFKKINGLVFISILVFSSASLFADGYKLELSYTLDSNAKQNYFPDLLIPISWNDNLNTSLEYRSGELTDERVDMSGNDTVSINENIAHKRFKLNLLNYRFGDIKSSYDIGFGVSYESYDKSQFGTYTSTTGDNYTNDIDVEVSSIYLKVQTIQRLEYLDFKAYVLAVPYSSLDVSQNTTFVGSIVNSSSGSSSETQDPTYEIDIDMLSKTGTFVDFAFLVNYRILPLKYSLSILGTNQEVDIDEKTLRLKASLLFNIKILNAWMPTLAYSTEDRKSDGESSIENKIYLGFNTRF